MDWGLPDWRRPELYRPDLADRRPLECQNAAIVLPWFRWQFIRRRKDYRDDGLKICNANFEELKLMVDETSGGMRFEIREIGNLITTFDKLLWKKYRLLMFCDPRRNDITVE